MRVNTKKNNMKEKIDLAITAYVKFRSKCEIISREAQKYIDFVDDISCDFYPSDGICICVNTAEYSMPLVILASTFFETAQKKGKLTHEDLKLITI